MKRNGLRSATKSKDFRSIWDFKNWLFLQIKSGDGKLLMIPGRYESEKIWKKRFNTSKSILILTILCTLKVNIQKIF
jgi:hypothetical protein